MSLLNIQDLVIHFQTEEGDVKAVNGISLSVDRGQDPRPCGRDRRGQDHHRPGHPPPGAGTGQDPGRLHFLQGKDVLAMSEKEVQDLPGQRDLHDLSGSHDRAEPSDDGGDQIAGRSFCATRTAPRWKRSSG